MKLSVIIVNYNHKHFPRLAVEALEKSKVNFPFEIIVFDNASHDLESLNFLDKAHNEKRITLVRSPMNIGFGKGNNIGAEISNGQYLFFHNPDLTVEKDTLQKMVDYIEKHPDIGVLGPKLSDKNGRVEPSSRRNMHFMDLAIIRTPLKKIPLFKKRVFNYLMADVDRNITRDVDLITGAAMLIPRVVFEQVKGFDPKYFLFMEDFDLCREIKKAGYRIVYYADAIAIHFPKRLSQGSLYKIIFKKVFWLHVASAFKYFWKWRKD